MLYAVVTPWLNHGREWFIRFVGTGDQCAEYHAEHYETTEYATIVELPDTTHTYKQGNIIPMDRR